MQNTVDSLLEINQTRNPYKDLLILVLFVIVGMFIAQFLGLLAVLPYFDYKINLFRAAMENPTAGESIKIPMLIIQALSSLCGFILAPILFIIIYEKRNIKTLEIKPKISFPIILTVLFLVIMAMPFNSLVIEWNQNWVFPEFMSGFENWAKEKEKTLEILTKNLTNLHGVEELVFGFIVFAILPAIGEELVFRGIIQKKFNASFSNIHIAIWLTGFIFSAIHMQFYGLIPRMLLGVMFGYLFYWSNNLAIPILAHFINNGFTVLMLFLRNEGLINIDIESTEGIPIEAALTSGLLVSGLMFGLYWYFQTQKGKNLPKYLKMIFE